MKKAHIPNYLDRKWLILLLTASVLFLLLFLTVALVHSKYSSTTDSAYEQSQFTLLDRDFGDGNERLGLPKLPRLAYLLSGTKGDVQRLRRLLQALYHPRNYYVLHMDLEASDAERLELSKYVKSEDVVRRFRNVMVVGKANLVTYKGPTMIASTLHAVSILLKRANDWDWFINLSSSDYPLMPQDGKVLCFSCLVFWLLECCNAFCSCFLVIFSGYCLY